MTFRSRSGGQFRGVRIDIAREVVEANAAALPADLDPTNAARFGDEVVKYVEEWIDENAGSAFTRSDRAVFVLSRDLEQDVGLFAPMDEVPMFSHDFDHDLVGNLHLCTWGLHDVLAGALPGTSARSVADALKAAGAGDRPTVYFYPGQRVLHFYPKGLNIGGERVEFRMDVRVATVTAEQVEDELESFYRYALRVPQRVPRIWQRGRPMRPVEEPEKEMQETFYILLRHSFRGSARIGREYVQDSGRADFVVEPRRNEEGDVCVIELKVLRSHWSTRGECTPAETRAAVEEVIRQAAEYRDELEADHAFACCYDMRTQDDRSLHDEFVPVAAGRDVRLRRWFLYRNYIKARDAGAFSKLRRLGSPVRRLLRPR